MNILELLTFRAFRPDPLDVTVPLLERMKGSRFVAVSGNVAGKNCRLKSVLVTVSPAGVPTFSKLNVFASASEDTTKQYILDLCDSFETRNVAILNSGILKKIVISDKVAPFSEVSNLEALELLRRNPTKLLSVTREADTLYSVVRHPTLQSALVFEDQRPGLVSFLDTLRNAGVSLLRVQCTLCSVLQYILDVYPEFIIGDSDLVVLDPVSPIWLFVDSGDWVVQPILKPLVNMAGGSAPEVPLTRLIESVLKSAATRGMRSCPVNVSTLMKSDIFDVYTEAKSEVPNLKYIFKDDFIEKDSILDFNALCHN